MSDDFLTGLEADLVEAMESYELRGRGRRLAVGRVPLPSPRSRWSCSRCSWSRAGCRRSLRRRLRG
jgi:hypothetical protein